MQGNRKASASLTAFALMIFLFFSILLMGYSFYQFQKFKSLNLEYSLQGQNSIDSFRTNLLQINDLNGSYLNYSDISASSNIKIRMQEGEITAYVRGERELIEVRASTLGIRFCDLYEFTPQLGAQFFNNGTCISVTTP